MNLLQLRYFQKVAQLSHVTRAAEELHISQPSLSKSISLLEEELGVPLFDHVGKNIRINRYGKVLLNGATRALSAIDDATAQIRDMKNAEPYHIRLGVLAAASLLPDLLVGFRLEHPDIEFTLLHQIDENNALKDCDVCIASSPVHRKGVCYISLLEEAILIALPSSHPLARHAHISLSDITEEGFIAFGKKRNLRRTIDTLCSQAGFHPNYVFESDDPAIVHGLVQAGLGIAFIPAIPWRGKHDNIVLRPIESPKFYRRIELCMPEKKYQPESVKTFCRYAKTYFQKLAAEL